MSKTNEMADKAATKGGVVAPLSTDRAKVLFRKIKTKVELEGADQQDSKNHVAFSKLYSFATGSQKC